MTGPLRHGYQLGLLAGGLVAVGLTFLVLAIVAAWNDRWKGGGPA